MPELFEGELTLTLSTGVLVIGSGCGGSSFTHSLARNLSSSAHFAAILSSWPDNRVSEILVIEKAQPTTSLPQTEQDSYRTMYEENMAVSSEDGSMTYVAGSTWGGGSRVNWSACLQTDRVVREEWTKMMVGTSKKGKERDPHGRMFLGKEWQDCMD